MSDKLLVPHSPEAERRLLQHSADLLTCGKLPPHSPEAERALVGCVFLDESILAKLIEKFGMTDGIFYETTSALVWQAMRGLFGEKRGVNAVTVIERLRQTGNLAAAGGEAAVSGLADKPPSSAMWPEFLRCVWERYVARVGIHMSATWTDRFMAGNGVSESEVARMQAEVADWAKTGAAILDERPKNLADPIDFQELYFDAWFNRDQETYGWPLPIEFPMRIRPSEMTVFTGESGSGKSSFIGQMTIVLGTKGVKTFIASMEVPPEITLWIMARQLLARGKLEDDRGGRAEAIRALAWLQRQVVLYNFQGITDWRELLNTCQYAREHNRADVFVIDSVMRIGVPDDDYALQGMVAERFASFAIKTGAHVVLVHHQNKATESRQKLRVRGSAQWTDNASNVIGMVRNDEKALEIEELKEKVRSKELTQEEAAKKEEILKRRWDAKFILSKQRFPGSLQNGSRYLWFAHDALQFLENRNMKPKSYLPEVETLV